MSITLMATNFELITSEVVSMVKLSPVPVSGFGPVQFFNPDWSEQAVRNWVARWVGGSKLNLTKVSWFFDPSAPWSDDRAKFVRVDVACRKCGAVLSTGGRCPDPNCDAPIRVSRGKESRQVKAARPERVCDDCGGRLVPVVTEFGLQGTACSECGLVH